MRTEDVHDEIAKIAYDLYLKSGCAPCRDLANWVEAEMIVLARHAGQDMEEPEEPGTVEEAEELQEAQTERFPAGQETAGREGETVMEELDAQEAAIPKKTRKRATPSERPKQAKKRAPAGKAAPKKGK